MARVGSTKIAKAFRNREPARTNNTYTNGNEVFLHNNRIMWREGGSIWFNLCGWNSVVTKDRLNHLFNELGLPLRISQKDYSLYIRNSRTREETHISSKLNHDVCDFM